MAFAAAHGGVPPEQARRMLKQFTEQRLNAAGPGKFGPPQDFRRFEEEASRRFEEFKLLEQNFRGEGAPQFSGQFPGGPGEFPGKPGEFPGGPGGQGEFQGGPAFVGPGGCTSPQECIKYCAEHKEECFGGPQGGQGDQAGRPQRGSESQQGGRPGGFEGFGGPLPQLRGNLIIKFDEKELPEGFEQKSEEEKKDFFHKSFNEVHGFPIDGQEGRGQFPGGQQQFPGKPGEFLGGQEGQQQQFPGKQEKFPARGTGGSPPDASGGFPGQGKMENFPGRPGQFEGSREFPGKSNEFPGGQQQQSPGKSEGGFQGQFPGRTNSPISIPGVFEPKQQNNLQPQQSQRLPNQGDFRQGEGSVAPKTGSQFPSSPSGSFQQPSGGETFKQRLICRGFVASRLTLPKTAA